jgi:hypothetical protein
MVPIPTKKVAGVNEKVLKIEASEAAFCPLVFLDDLPKLTPQTR